MANNLINAAHVRRLALEAANERRERLCRENPALSDEPYRRVGDDFFNEIQIIVRRAVEDRARAHWQKGITLQ